MKPKPAGNGQGNLGMIFSEGLGCHRQEHKLENVRQLKGLLLSPSHRRGAESAVAFGLVFVPGQHNCEAAFRLKSGLYACLTFVQKMKLKLEI